MTHVWLERWLSRWRRRERRRFNIGTQANWEPRAEAAIRLWGESDAHLKHRSREQELTVADYGAGNERLRFMLARTMPYPVDYRSYDINPQQPTTAYLDVAQGLPDSEVDLAFCLGLFEYIPQENLLIPRLNERCRFVIHSYVMLQPDVHTLSQREAHGWVRHQTADELEADFAVAGYELVSSREVPGSPSRLWLWDRGT